MVCLYLINFINIVKIACVYETVTKLPENMQEDIPLSPISRCLSNQVPYTGEVPKMLCEKIDVCYMLPEPNTTHICTLT